MDPGSISSTRLAGSVPQDQMTCSDFCGSEYSCGQYAQIEANTCVCIYYTYIISQLMPAIYSVLLTTMQMTLRRTTPTFNHDALEWQG